MPAKDSHSRSAIVVAAVVCLTRMAAARSSSSKFPSVAAGHSSSTATVNVRSTSTGMVLADSAGRPLYIYSADGSGATASGCTGGLRIRVAAVELERDPDRRAGRDRDAGQALLGQVTWNGHPLYTLASDSPGGNTTGNGVSGFHLAVASGSTAPATTTTTKASSGYRY